MENTLAAFEHSARLPIFGAELDVQLTSDGQVVVHHDAHLNPQYTRGPAGLWLDKNERVSIGMRSYEELQHYDIGVPRPGSSYSRKFDRIVPVPGQRLPLLADVIRCVQALSDHFFLIVEIKTPILESSERKWQRLVDRTLETLDREGFGDRFLLCSFDWAALRYAMEQRPGTRTWFTTHPLSWYGSKPASEVDLRPGSGYLTELRGRYATGNAPWFGGFDPRDFPGGHAEAISCAGGEAWFMYHRDSSANRVRMLRAAGLIGAAWSVNLKEPCEVQRLERDGMTAVCIDYPDASGEPDVDTGALREP